MEESQHKIINYVHENTIMAETVAKILRHQKLYTKFMLNPYKPLHIITGKPNVKQEVEEPEEALLQIVHNARLVPTEVHEEPLSVNQEYGWISEPLFQRPWNDRRFNYGKNSCEMTRFMSSFWQQKEAMAIGGKRMKDE